MIPARCTRVVIGFALATATGFGVARPAPGQDAVPLREASGKETAELRAVHERIENLIEGNDWWAAERCCRDFLILLKPFVADRSPEMCRQRVRLAKIYRGQGRYDSARTLLREQVERLRRYDAAKDRDLDPIDYPQALYLLAVVETDLNAPEVGVRHAEEVLALLAERHLEGDELTALARRQRGVIRAGQGDYQFARMDFEAALKSSEAWEPPGGVFRATLHQCLAATWIAEAEQRREAGRADQVSEALDKAEGHLTRAEAYCRSELRLTPQLAAFTEVVGLAREVLDAARARAAAPPTATTVFGTPHILHASSARSGTETKALRLNFRAYSDATSGRIREADEGLTQALAILSAAGVPTHSRVQINCQLNQAVLWSAFLGRDEDAVRQADAALDQLYRLTLDALAFQSLRQQQAALESCEDALRQYVSVAVKAGRPAAEIYLHILRWKGILFALYDRSSRGPEAQADHARLRAAVEEARTARMHCVESPRSTQADRRETFETLERCQRTLSDFLTRTHPLTREKAPTASEIANRLPPGTVFLDYATYIDFDRPDSLARDLRPHLKYLAFVLRAGSPEVIMVRLSPPLGTLNGQIFRWRELLPVSAANRTHEPELRRVASQIADGLWRPVEPHCRDARLLWVCPTGLIWAFPFAALPWRETDYLVRHTPIAYAVAAGQVVRSEGQPRAQADGRKPYALVSEIGYAEREQAILRARLVTAGLKRWLDDADVVQLSGSKATKAGFLHAVRDSGTNVCFVGHGIQSEKVREERVILYTPTELTRQGQADDLTSDSAQFRIPLAGAKLTPRPAPGDAGDRESWVSPDELMNAVPAGANRFEFWACSVFLGPIHPTEGMLGCPRALLLGGYRSVVAAQWGVHECAALPTIPQHFHRCVLGENLGNAVALQHAQCAAIDGGEVNANPFHWAAWVVIGDPGRVDHPPTAPPVPALPADGLPPGFVVAAGGVAALVAAGSVWSVGRRRRHNGT